MRTTLKILLVILQVAVIAQLALGILFWTGHGLTYIPVHIAIGSVLVLVLWTVAVLALVMRVRRGLAAFELVWALALAMFGMQQATILVGPLHWIIRVVHLLMAIVAVRLAESLSKSIIGTLPERVGETDREDGGAAVGRVR